MTPAQLNQLFLIGRDLEKQVSIIERELDVAKRLIAELRVLEATAWAESKDREASDEL